jgi:hypothetical protein
MVGTPDEAIAEILAQHQVFRHERDPTQMPVGDPQAAILRSIELLGAVVAPKVRAELALDASSPPLVKAGARVPEQVG